MHLQHWGIQRTPFRASHDPATFYCGSTHEEALARIDFLASQGRRMGVLLGEAGTGKSFTLRMAATSLARAGVQVVLVDAMGLSSRELFWQIASQLGAAPHESDETVVLWQRISDRLYENRLLQMTSVLLIDDAGLAGPDLMKQIFRLARMDADGDSPWTIVLAAKPSQAIQWPAAFRQQIALRIVLESWEPADTVGFVQAALVEAGRYDPIFDESALYVLHELAQGNPRQVARLADIALLKGAVAQSDRIDEQIVRSAQEELQWASEEVEV